VTSAGIDGAIVGDHEAVYLSGPIRGEGGVVDKELVPGAGVAVKSLTPAHAGA